MMVQIEPSEFREPPPPPVVKERFWGSPRGSEIGCYACGVGMVACFLIGWALFGLGIWLIIRENKAEKAWEEENWDPWWEANQCTSRCLELEKLVRGAGKSHTSRWMECDPWDESSNTAGCCPKAGKYRSTCRRNANLDRPLFVLHSIGLLFTIFGGLVGCCLGMCGLMLICR
eukprot:TRINITY_DN67912_c0_g12_i1.p2 TRINITY_DN67912_c0_g12~~TRINITY_DN67912_c0_g12_i1.p2  ORF type:complete len:173 (+),score=2.02 TRINITY_DN67912_c0_g12_i1:84-602(+)